MKIFIPDKVYLDPRASKYDIAKISINHLKELNVPIEESRKVVIDGKTPLECLRNSQIEEAISAAKAYGLQYPA